MRFEHVWVDDGGGNANVLGIGPKISLMKDHLALYVPVGFAFGEDVGDVSETWEIHPTILATIQVGDFVEINPSVKYLLLLAEDSDDFVAFNLGLGIHLGSSKFVLRPEYGLMYLLGEDGHYSQLSVGLTFYH
jgi:hypothetical protein